MGLTDIELMEQVREGDDKAFELLVMRHQQGLINYFFRLSWNSALAEDQAQETFLRLYEHRHRYKPVSKFSTYLYRIARNLWVDHIRKMTRRGITTSLDVEIEDLGALRDMIESKDRGEKKAKDVEEKMMQVMKAVESLTQAQRELFTLAQIERLKYQQISKILGIPEGTVKTRMHAMMKKLRKALVSES